MRKLLLAAALALGACGGGINTDHVGIGNPATGTAGYTYPHACGQFCQALSTRALDCVRGQGRWTQQDLQAVSGSCNQELQAKQTAAPDCEAASAEVARDSCSQICNLIGVSC